MGLCCGFFVCCLNYFLLLLCLTIDNENIQFQCVYKIRCCQALLQKELAHSFVGSYRRRLWSVKISFNLCRFEFTNQQDISEDSLDACLVFLHQTNRFSMSVLDRKKKTEMKSTNNKYKNSYRTKNIFFYID